MSRKTERRHQHGKRRKRKNETTQIAAAVSRGTSVKPVAFSPNLSEVQLLLHKLAESMNALEDVGISVTLANDAVITDHGYVFKIDTGDVETWEPRSRLVAPFPVPDAVHCEED